VRTWILEFRSNKNQIHIQNKCGIRSENITFQHQAKHEKDLWRKRKNHSSHWRLQICGLLFCKLNFLHTWNLISVSKFVQLNDMLISYPCAIFIYYYPYLFVVQFFRSIYMNFIRGSVEMFLMQEGSVATLNWGTVV
jgi:cation transport ATPase